MIPQINKILYATDLSPNSTYAFRYAINTAKQNDAGIIILHVHEPLSLSAQTSLNSVLSGEQQRLIFEQNIAQTKDRIKTRLKRFCGKELSSDPECFERVVSIEVCEGFPADRILEKADEFDCDIIILGTHGKGIIKNTFLGSTSHRVLRRVRKPVCIIPLPKGEIDITVHDF